jgi:heat shock protein HslJ
MMACAMDLMQQESDFVAALTMATGYRVWGDSMELLNADRVLARFVAVYTK